MFQQLQLGSDGEHDGHDDEYGDGLHGGGELKHDEHHGE